MTQRIATVSGTMLTPGVSRNRRLYTPELIARAARRMRERIADPDGLPIVMRTHHDAGDDSRLIVGRLTSVTVEKDGSARYRADLYDTAPGRDIAALVTGTQPALRSVSIHGYWLGPLQRVQHEGETVTTADDLEIDAVDFTATPGVMGATVAAASYTPDEAPAAESAGRVLISESVQASVDPLGEPLAGEAYSVRQRRVMVGRGQAMADGSYPVKSRADLRRAIRAVGRGGADHDAIRCHIVQRATALGLTAMVPDNWNKDGSMKENTIRLGEIREYYPNGPEGSAGICIDAYNGPVSLTMRACGLDPAELRAVAQAAMAAAVDALGAMDPDMDADTDVPGAPHADTNGDTADGESAPVAPMVAAAVAEALALVPPVLGVATTTTQEEAAMGEPNTPTDDEAVPTRSLTDADISALGALVGAALKESLEPIRAAITEQAAALVPEAAESAPAPTSSKPGKKAAAKALKETAQAEIQQLREELRTQVRDELREEILRENGLPARRGFRVHENDQAGGPEPSDEDLFNRRADVLLGDFGRTPQPAP